MMRKLLYTFLALVSMCVHAGAYTLDVEEGVVKLNQGKGYRRVEGQVEATTGNLVYVAKDAKAKLIASNGTSRYLESGATTRILGRTCVTKSLKPAQEEVGCADGLADPSGAGGAGGLGALALAGAVIGGGVAIGMAGTGTNANNPFFGLPPFQQRPLSQ